MPLPMVHLSTAEKMTTITALKSPEFYLGSIAPDAIHMREGFVREDKTRSHWNARELTAIAELDSFCTMLEKSTGKEREFLSGYLVHILTDLFWEDTILKLHRERYANDPSPMQDKKMAYYNDTDQLDFVLFERQSWRPKVWEWLAQAEAFSIEGIIDKEEVIAWNRRTLNWYDSGKSEHSNPVKYLNYDDLTQFTEYAAKKCDDYLIAKGLAGCQI